MKVRFAVLIFCSLWLATASRAQQPPPQSTASHGAQTDSCPSPPEGKEAWFDTCKYLPLGNGVKPGRVTSMRDPEYSEFARKKKIKGEIQLAVAINAEGAVDAVKVLTPLEPGQDKNAKDAVKQWKFTPATMAGKPVAIQIPVTVTFNLY